MPLPNSTRPDRRRHTSPRPKSSRTVIAGIACIVALAACGSSPSGSASDADDDVASLGTVDDGSGDAAGSTDESTQDTTTADSVDPQEAFVEYTECMRDEGIDMPDPQFSTAEAGKSGQVVTVNSEVVDGDAEQGPRIDFDSEEYEAANEVCGSILDNAFGDIEIDPELEAEQREQMLAFAECMREQGLDFPDPIFSDNGGAMQVVGEEAEGASDGFPGSEKWDVAFEVCGDEMPPVVAGGRADG